MASTERAFNVLTVILSIAAVTVVGRAMLNGQTRSGQGALRADSTIPNWRQFQRGPATFGPESAPVTITLFSDIRCGYCRKSWSALRSAVERHPGTVRVIYRHHPFKGLSLSPARAGVCAARQGRLEEIYSRYIESYESLPADDRAALEKSLRPEDWEGLARAAGQIDLQEFTKCLATDSLPPELLEDMRVAQAIGVPAVPTLLVNGVRTIGVPGEIHLEELIQQAERTQ